MAGALSGHYLVSLRLPRYLFCDLGVVIQCHFLALFGIELE